MNIFLKMKEYIEKSEEELDWQLGSGRKIDKIIADNGMPEIYNEVLKAIAESESKYKVDITFSPAKVNHLELYGTLNKGVKE